MYQIRHLFNRGDSMIDDDVLLAVWKNDHVKQIAYRKGYEAALNKALSLSKVMKDSDAYEIMLDALLIQARSI